MKNWKKRVLVLSPHADDETIGCGGMIANAIRGRNKVLVIVLEMDREDSMLGERVSLARYKELEAAMEQLGVKAWRYACERLSERPDAMPYRSTIAGIDEALDEFQPTSVFIPYPSHHQDHRRLYEAALAGLRQRPNGRGAPELVAMYEYPYIETWPPPDINAGRFIMDITESWEAKKNALRAYQSQIADHKFLSLFRIKNLAERRGEEIGARYGEAFYLLRGALS